MAASRCRTRCWRPSARDPGRGDARPGPGVRLALVAALQYLPARQRAVLILRDVLDWPAAEVAEPARHHHHRGQQRAAAGPRAASAGAAGRGRGPPSRPSRDLRALLDRFAAAFENADVTALAALLREDAALEMPPLRDLVLRPGVGARLRGLEPGRGPRAGCRLVPTAANGQPAFAAYLRDADGVYRRARDDRPHPDRLADHAHRHLPRAGPVPAVRTCSRARARRVRATAGWSTSLKGRRQRRPRSRQEKTAMSIENAAADRGQRRRPPEDGGDADPGVGRRLRHLPRRCGRLDGPAVAPRPPGREPVRPGVDDQRLQPRVRLPDAHRRRARRPVRAQEALRHRPRGIHRGVHRVRDREQRGRVSRADRAGRGRGHRAACLAHLDQRGVPGRRSGAPRSGSGPASPVSVLPPRRCLAARSSRASTGSGSSGSTCPSARCPRWPRRSC